MTDTKLIERLTELASGKGHHPWKEYSQAFKDAIAALSAQPGPVGAEPLPEDIAHLLNASAVHSSDCKNIMVVPTSKVVKIVADLWARLRPAPELAAADEERFEELLNRLCGAAVNGSYIRDHKEALRTFFKSSRSAQVGMMSLSAEDIQLFALLHKKLSTRPWPTADIGWEVIEHWAQRKSASTTHGGER